MNSLLPKVLQLVAGKPMLEHVLLTARELVPHALHVVVGHGADEVRVSLDKYPVNWVLQAEQLGTGHAVQQALPHCHQDAVVLILYGDVPLIRAETLNTLISQVKVGASLGLLTACLENPHGYGRVIRDGKGSVARIVEHKDASREDEAIREVNTGVMAVAAKDLGCWLDRLDNKNAQGEYYLTDIIAMACEQGMSVNAVQVEHEYEMLGVNNRQQQAEVERHCQRIIAEKMMQSGVAFSDPNRFDCRGTVKTGCDVFIDGNVLLEGTVELGNGVVIEMNCIVRDSVIGDGCRIKSNSVVEGARLGMNVDVGPFARIRPGTVLGNGVRIGNFVEMKNSVLGENSKANHLAYVGDALVGDDCNIGAGTITCNYDGVHKHKTNMGDGVFIGSNSTLVAPVSIGNGGFVAAGSTVTKDISSGELAVARSRQRNIDGWKRPGQD